MSIIFNGESLKNPNQISEVPKVLVKSEKRSVNNTLTTDIFDFPSKKEYVLAWNYLTSAEFTTLMSYVDIGQIPVSSDIANHTFTFTLASVGLQSDVTHTYSGYRETVTLLIREA